MRSFEWVLIDRDWIREFPARIRFYYDGTVEASYEAGAHSNRRSIGAEGYVTVPVGQFKSETTAVAGAKTYLRGTGYLYGKVPNYKEVSNYMRRVK